MDSRQAEVEVNTGSLRGRPGVILDILGSLCLIILDSIGLDWIWPFAWTYFVLVADPPLCTSWDLRLQRSRYLRSDLYFIVEIAD
jgi:hypothetical protein